MKLYNIEIKFPRPTYARIIGGHPEGSLVFTTGVVIDTIDDRNEPHYHCVVIGYTSAVYPYTSSPHRVFPQSQLEHLTKPDPRALDDFKSTS